MSTSIVQTGVKINPDIGVDGNKDTSTGRDPDTVTEAQYN